MGLRRRLGLMCVGLCAGLALSGCGGSGDAAEGGNDQGIVFRALGFFRGLEAIEDTDIQCTEPNVQNAISDSSYTIDLDFVDFFPDRFRALANPCGGYIALENNLAAMGINVQEVVGRYEIPGAAVSLEPNSITVASRIDSASSDAESPSGVANRVYIQLVGEMLPERVIVFLEQNRNRLPATPYALNAFFVAKGQSDNGTRYASNEIGYQFEITR